MPQLKEPISLLDYGQMASELEIMSDSIRARPDMDHHFAERLARIAWEMRQDLSERVQK